MVRFLLTPSDLQGFEPQLDFSSGGVLTPSDDLRSAFRDCDAGFAGALRWLADAQSIFMMEVQARNPRREQIVGSVTLVAESSRLAHSDPLELAAAGRRSCGHSARLVELPISGSITRALVIKDRLGHGFMVVRSRGSRVTLAFVEAAESLRSARSRVTRAIGAALTKSTPWLSLAKP